ncbi:hypothetical protein HDF15_002770 [Granulicella mallensis]|uniref:Uncharacterized protein n=1 Tax=Granulicella mallensis TaxID=940614 RepID=A0A7W7ZQS5_9BACT|nr:hypothetical protein [Granulicella mallensis]
MKVAIVFALPTPSASRPVIDPIEWSEDVTTEDIGTDHQDVWTIAEICERNAQNITLSF